MQLYEKCEKCGQPKPIDISICESCSKLAEVEMPASQEGLMLESSTNEHLFFVLPIMSAVLVVAINLLLALHVYYSFSMEWQSHRSLSENYFNCVGVAILFAFPLLLALRSILKMPKSISAHFIVWTMAVITGYITYVYAFQARGPDTNVLLMANLVLFYICGFLASSLAKRK